MFSDFFNIWAQSDDESKNRESNKEVISTNETVNNEDLFSWRDEYDCEDLDFKRNIEGVDFLQTPPQNYLNFTSSSDSSYLSPTIIDNLKSTNNNLFQDLNNEIFDDNKINIDTVGKNRIGRGSGSGSGESSEGENESETETETETETEQSKSRNKIYFLDNPEIENLMSELNYFQKFVKEPICKDLINQEITDGNFNLSQISNKDKKRHLLEESSVSTTANKKASVVQKVRLSDYTRFQRDAFQKFDHKTLIGTHDECNDRNSEIRKKAKLICRKDSFDYSWDSNDTFHCVTHENCPQWTRVTVERIDDEYSQIFCKYAGDPDGHSKIIKSKYKAISKSGAKSLSEHAKSFIRSRNLIKEAPAFIKDKLSKEYNDKNNEFDLPCIQSIRNFIKGEVRKNRFEMKTNSEIKYVLDKYYCKSMEDIINKNLINAGDMIVTNFWEREHTVKKQIFEDNTKVCYVDEVVVYVVFTFTTYKMIVENLQYALLNIQQPSSPDGLFAHLDSSHKVLHDGLTFSTLGYNTQVYNDNKGRIDDEKVVRTGRLPHNRLVPVLYMVSKSENSLDFEILFKTLLQMVCSFLSKNQLILNGVTTDHSTAMAKAISLIMNRSTSSIPLLMVACYFHVIKGLRDNWCKIKNKDSNYNPNINSETDVEIYTCNTQETFIVEEVEEEEMLTCDLSNTQSQKLIEKIKPIKKNDIIEAVIKPMVQFLHHSRSVEQFDSLKVIVIKIWLHLGEVDFANNFNDIYLHDHWRLWFCNSKAPGQAITNNVQESFQSVIKKCLKRNTRQSLSVALSEGGFIKNLLIKSDYEFNIQLYDIIPANLSQLDKLAVFAPIDASVEKATDIILDMVDASKMAKSDFYLRLRDLKILHQKGSYQHGRIYQFSNSDLVHLGINNNNECQQDTDTYFVVHGNPNVQFSCSLAKSFLKSMYCDISGEIVEINSIGADMSKFQSFKDKYDKIHLVKKVKNHYGIKENKNTIEYYKIGENYKRLIRRRVRHMYNKQFIQTLPITLIHENKEEMDYNFNYGIISHCSKLNESDFIFTVINAFGTEEKSLEEIISLLIPIYDYNFICTCKMFNVTTYYCSHILAVMSLPDVGLYRSIFVGQFNDIKTTRTATGGTITKENEKRRQLRNFFGVL